MPDFFEQLSAFTVFLGIAGFGFLFLLVALVFGEVFEHLGFEHDHDAGMEHGGPSFLSPRILSVFITAFGGTGALVISNGFSVLPASAAGFVSGIFFATLIYWFAKFLYGQQATTRVQGSDMVGRTGRITVTIPASGIGQVRCQIGEELVDKIARSRSGEKIPENTIVVVEEVLGEVVVVRPQ